jgi:hypothetical protein
MIRFLDGHKTVTVLKLRNCSMRESGTTEEWASNSLKPNQENLSNGGTKLEFRWTKSSERKGD